MANDTERRITARMILDSSGFNASLQGVNNSLKLAQSELKNASAQVGAYGRTTENLKGVQQALSQQYSEQSKKVDIYRESIIKSTEKMNANITERDRLKASLNSANTVLEATIQQYGEESNEVDLVREGIENLNEEIAKQEKVVENNARQITTYTTNLNNAEAELGRIRTSLNNTNTQIATNESRWISAGKAMQEAGDKMKTLGDGMNKTGDSILKATAPLVGMGVVSTKLANDFEDAMAKVSTIADNSTVSMDDLKQGIVSLSNDTGKPVGDLAEGLYEAISSGVKTADAISFMAGATKAAVGGFTDTKTSVDGLTTILNSYGLKATEVTNISNQMMVAQNLGKTTFGDMAEQIGDVTAVSAALGVTTKELFSSLAVLTSNGIKTAEAVTGVKAAMSNIIEPSKEASDAAEALGLKFDASQVSAQGWMGFLKGVKDKLKEVAPDYANAVDRVASLEAAMKSGSGAVANHSAEIANLKSKIKELGGTTEVADYSDQISVLRDKIKDLTSGKVEVSDYSEKIASLRSKIKELTSATPDVANYATQIAGLRSKISELNNESSKTKDKGLKEQYKEQTQAIKDQIVDLQKLQNQSKANATSVKNDNKEQADAIRKQIEELQNLEKQSKTNAKGVKSDNKEQADAIRKQIEELQNLEKQSKNSAKGVKAENKEQVAIIREQIAALQAQDKATKGVGGSNKDLANELKNAKAEMAALETGSSSQISAFGTMFGSVKALNSMLALTSDQGMALYNDSMNQMGDGTNRIDSAFDKVNNTSGKNLTKTINELKNAGIKLGEALQPMLLEGTELVAGITKKLEGMDEETVRTIAKVTLFTAGLGVVLKVGGTVIATVGTITKVVGTLSTTLGTATIAAEGAGASAGLLALALNPVTLGIGAVVIAGVGLNYFMSKKLIPTVDLFGDSCSENTKKAVNSYMDLDKKVAVSLLSLKANHTVITGDIAIETEKTFADMATKINEGNDKHYEEDIANLKKYYTDRGLENSKEAQETLTLATGVHDLQKQELDEYQVKIKNIYQNAYKDHRELTQKEEDEIADIRATMQAKALSALSQSQAEQNAMRTKARLQAGDIATLEALEVIKASVKQRDETVRLAEEACTKTIDSISRQRDQGVIASDDMAKKMIASAEDVRSQAIEKAKSMHKGVVDELEAQNKDIDKKLNTDTGSVKDSWDKLGDYLDSHPFSFSHMWDNFKSGWSDIFKGDFGEAWKKSDVAKIFGNASGTDNFEGGLTTMHEKGYEVYNLPKGSKIYNHEASQDMVLKTAQEVAKGVLSNMTASSSGGTQTIIVPVYLDGREIARVTSPHLDKIQGNNLVMAGRNTVI